jgi:formamidopyrimidine-DNA glycosylase
MPELPEVESLRRSLAPAILGRRIVATRVHDRRLRVLVDETRLRDEVVGRRIVALSRRSKYLLVELDGGATLIVHFGMSGRFERRRALDPVPPHVHVVFSLDDGHELRFRDPRRFGLVDVVPRDGLARDVRLASLGPEPLEQGFDAAYLRARARGSRRPIKSLIMDAATVVGVGNIYASESLFRAGIRPRRSAGRVSNERLDRLVSAIREVLGEAIRCGGTTLEDWQDAEGHEGDFQSRLFVYQREGEPCKICDARIQRVVLAGRSTFYCPRCQA